MILLSRPHLDAAAALVAALGAGLGASFDLTQRRYDRVLLLMAQAPESYRAMITHRLPLLGVLDKVMVLMNGAVEKYGTLAEVLPRTSPGSSLRVIGEA